MDAKPVKHLSDRAKPESRDSRVVTSLELVLVCGVLSFIQRELT